MDAPLPKSDPREESGRMNGIIMGIIYIAVFVPGIILFSILHRKSWISSRNGGFIQTTVVYSLFLAMFVFRVIMGLIFLLGFATPAFATMAADSVYNYWIPTVCILLEFAVLTQLMALWNRITRTVATKRVLRKQLVTSSVVALACLSVIALVSLIVLRPTGAAGGENPRLYEATTYHITFFICTLVATIFIITLLSIMADRLRRLQDKSEIRDPEMEIFVRRVRGYVFAASIALVIRTCLDIILTVLRPSEEIILRVLEMIVHALPELILGYTFIGISWRRIFSFSEATSDSSQME